MFIYKSEIFNEVEEDISSGRIKFFELYATHWTGMIRMHRAGIAFAAFAFPC